MLKDLLNIEKELSQHLENLSEWKSVFVDYHKPYVKRLWKQVGEAFTCIKFSHAKHTRACYTLTLGLVP